MKTMNAAVTAMALSQALDGMVLHVTVDTMAPSSSFAQIDYVAAAQADAIDELRHSGAITIIAGNASLDDRDDLRLTMERLEMDLPGLATLHGEAILFDCGKVVARTAATTVVPSDLVQEAAASDIVPGIQKLLDLLEAITPEGLAVSDMPLFDEALELAKRLAA